MFFNKNKLFWQKVTPSVHLEDHCSKVKEMGIWFIYALSNC